MQVVRLLLLAAIVLLPCGCVTSLHPLGTEDVVVFEKWLLGEWERQGSPGNSLTISRAPKNFYQVAMKCKVEDREAAGSFLARLVRLKGHLFAEVVPNPKWNKEDRIERSPLFFQPQFHILKLTRHESGFSWLRMREDVLKRILKDDPQALKHEDVGGRIVITAGSKELQKFVLAHADDGLFSNALIDKKSLEGSIWSLLLTEESLKKLARPEPTIWKRARQSDAEKQKNLNHCKANLKWIATAMQLYRQRFKYYPRTRSGSRFLLAPLKGHIVARSTTDSLERTLRGMYVCPGDPFANQALTDVMQAYGNLDNVSPAAISYAGRNTVDFPLDPKKAKYEAIACDAGGAAGDCLNHDGVIHVVFLDMHVETIRLSDYPGVDKANFKVGPDSPIPVLRTLNKNR